MSVTLSKNIRKLTGPVEHWVTTYNSGYWGFVEKYGKKWRNDIHPGDVFVFHAASPEYIVGSSPDLGAGIIGLGRVGAKSTKSEPVWWEEIHTDGRSYPYLIHFSEIYWFGDTSAIEDRPIAEKTESQVREEAMALSENKISFSDMADAGYRIPAQGSISGLSGIDKLFPLIRERLESATIDEDPGTEESGEIELGDSSTNNIGASRGSSSLRERNRDRNLSPDTVDNGTVETEQSLKEQIEASLNHEETLDVFEDYLKKRGFDTGETKHSDILGTNELHVVLAEAKSIHNRNESTQIRGGLGQLLEYTYFDVTIDEDRSEKELTRCLVLTQEPSEDYRKFLNDLQSDGIYTFWTDEYQVKGLPQSMDRLKAVTK